MIPKKHPRNGYSIRSRWLLGNGVLLRLVDPRHLYGFENFFSGSIGRVIEAIKRHDPLVQIGEANGERVDVWMGVAQSLGNAYGVSPFHQ